MKERLSLQASIAFVMLYISLITMFASLMLAHFVLLTISGLIALVCIYLLLAREVVVTRKSVLLHAGNNIYLLLLLVLGFLLYFGINFAPSPESNRAEYVYLVGIYLLWIVGYYAQWRSLQNNGNTGLFIMLTFGVQAIWIFTAPFIISIFELFLE